MASLNYLGGFVASKKLEVNEDEYEDEDERLDEMKFSYLQFFSSERD